jgi:hypothetical protein
MSGRTETGDGTNQRFGDLRIRRFENVEIKSLEPEACAL